MQNPQPEKDDLAELLSGIETYLRQTRLLHFGQQVRSQFQEWRQALFQQRRRESLWRSLRWS